MTTPEISDLDFGVSNYAFNTFFGRKSEQIKK